MKIPLYLGPEHDCDYLPDLKAQVEFVDPNLSLDGHLYERLLSQGFRRSGDLVYRPRCAQCAACVPVRLATAEFSPNRSQRRVLERNRDLSVRAESCRLDERHYQLFHRYCRARHEEGHMADLSSGELERFFCCRWGTAGFYEFRKNNQLLAVAVVDTLPDSLSAVYTFFDPEHLRRSLGTFAILWQVEQARRLNLTWVYLGFWISTCRKMSYKGVFRPLQAFSGSVWISLP